ncbi:MAG TPA: gliding motility-associated C-terminal domain-containing protein [Cytophagaceae bacterium]
MKSWILFFSLLVISYQGYTQNLVVNIGVIIDTLADPCDGPITLDCHYPTSRYNIKWNTNETTQTIRVSTTDTFIVEVSDRNNPLIKGVDTATVTYVGAFKIDLGKDTSSFCAGCITLDAGKNLRQTLGTRYQWSTGETTQKIRVCKSGKVSVTATNRFGCTATDNIFLNIIGNQAYTFNPSPDVNVCAGSTVTLKSGITPGIGKKLWSTGAETETINVTQSGKYVVKIFDIPTVCDSKLDTIIDTILVNINNPIVQLGPDQSKCGGCVTLSAGTQPPGSIINWSTGSKENTINVCTPGLNVITLTVTGPDNCSTSDEIRVDIKDNFTVDLGSDVLECAPTHTINARSFPGATYVWSTGETTSSIVVSNSGTYKVKIYNLNSCSALDTLTDEVKITFVSKLPTPGAITEVAGPCVDKKFTIVPVEGVSKFQWSAPEGWVITKQSETEITVRIPEGTPRSGTISVRSTNEGENCGSELSSINTEVIDYDIKRFNSFTPNNDGINDVWVVRNINLYPDNSLTILNRWGNEVYTKKGYNNEWDGSGLNEGTYFYKLNVNQCGQMRNYEGNVTLVR